MADSWKTAPSILAKKPRRADYPGHTGDTITRWFPPGPPTILICISLSLWHPCFLLPSSALRHFAFQISFIPTEGKANMNGFCGNSSRQNACVKMSKHSFYEQIVEQQIFLPLTPSLIPLLIKPLPSTSHLCWIPLDLILNMTFLIDLLPDIQGVKYSKN